MTATMEVRRALPTWAFALFLSVPIATFWRANAGKDFAFAYLFLGCALLVADSILSALTGPEPSSPRLWRAKMGALVPLLTASALVFGAVGMSMDPSPSIRTPLAAVATTVPALCCVPLFTVLTRSRFAGAIFAALLLGVVKILGCVVVRCVYGPDALDQGYMDLPWSHPNLLVICCMVGAALCSAILYPLGRRAFLRANPQNSQ